jgi:hypothetical protein
MKLEWYIAELVMEISVSGDARNVVHQNMMLFSAYSADEAYTKSSNSGMNAETTYDNPAGKEVTIRFIGVAHLSLVDEELEDGAELMFTATVGMPNEAVKGLIPNKEKLRAFIPPRRADGPDFASGTVVQQVEEVSGQVRPKVTS